VWDEESGVLHRELEGFESIPVRALATFLSPDGQQPRLVAGMSRGHLQMYDPEAGSALHCLEGHLSAIQDLACIASSSAAPHHPRVVSACYDRTVKVWDGETGEWLADLGRHTGPVRSVAVWKEHTGGRDRIALGDDAGRIKIWDGEALTLLHDLEGGHAVKKLSAFRSAEGPARLLMAPVAEAGLQVWDPEEGRLLHHGIGRGWLLEDFHLFESAQGRLLLAIAGLGTTGRGEHQPRQGQPGGTVGTRLDVWNLGEAPAAEGHMRPAHKHG
jgi:WD40 repeat protein